MDMPNMVKIRQRFARDRLDDPAAAVSAGLASSGLLDAVRPGMRIAVTAGSRGIASIPGMLRAVAGELRARRAEPFIVPAMGSHGGCTAVGQARMLVSLGITEEAVGAPVVSSMETVEIGRTPSGAPVFMDRAALGADGIVAVNRVKIHTAFHGDIESGLCKMVVVGLGKKRGAETFHRFGMGGVLADSFRVARREAKLLAGVAILENAYDETMDVRIAAPADFETVDREMLAVSRGIVPRIPISPFDILIVDEMGKNISGTGMDTNVVGFWRRYGGERDPDYSTLIVLSLTPESHGNAMGIGLADLTTKRLVESVDFDATYANALTSQFAMGRTPVALASDRDCLEAALARHDTVAARIVRIRNTLHLEELSVSENLLPALAGNPSCETAGDPAPMRFDADGFLV